MAYGPRGKKKKAPKGFSKKAAKKVKATIGKPITKRHGKTVMTADPDKKGRKVGYASTTKTKLPKYSPKSLTTKKGRKATKKASKRR